MNAGSGVLTEKGIGKHIIRLHHIGIVFPGEDGVKRSEKLAEVLGLQVDYENHINAYDSDLIFTKHDGTFPTIEFILPFSGVLTEYNNGKGGIAHLCVEVDDIKACEDEIRAMGMEMLEKEAVQGTDFLKANFIRPKYTAGVLIELVQIEGDIDYNYRINRSK